MISTTENPPLGFLVWYALSPVELSHAFPNLREEAEAFDRVLYRRIVREPVDGFQDPLFLSHRSLLSVALEHESVAIIRGSPGCDNRTHVDGLTHGELAGGTGARVQPRELG